MGRPTAFKIEYIEQAKKICWLGAIDKQLADIFEVSEKTLQTWKKKHPDFLHALKEGKAIADGTVIQSLFNRANGCVTTEDKEIGGVVVTLEKTFPPDTTACIFWLKNRQPANWRDKTDQEVSGDLTVNVKKYVYEK